ncbi:MAG: ABC transporter ATP-binding protein [Treponema sp.]|jgi:oligopeptide/dipeptide ABC transporter ATP-binding protein|nr:ABC transporter ATP-binding protein [Treponema sp.]
MTGDSILDIRNLSVGFGKAEERILAVQNLSLTLKRGQTLGLVGESGCGKSVTSLAVMGLLPAKGCWREGKILFNGQDLLSLPEKEMNDIRGRKISMIFQEPMTSLNPVFTIGYQIGEALRIHQGLRGPKAREECLKILDIVGIPEPERVIDDYPHKLSGGMRQRVMIAMAVSCKATLLIADEPTTALDVTIQALILDLLKTLKKRGNLTMLFISHDLGIIAEVADEVAVMYAGVVVEKAPVEELYRRPLHPYTYGLMRARKAESGGGEKRRLYSIPGLVPSPYERRPGCPFAERCFRRTGACTESLPPLAGTDAQNGGHLVRCLRPGPEEEPYV